jgi:predicted dehydrogenase
MSRPVLLVGAGPMAVEYARVLEFLDIEYVVKGRGVNSAKNFEYITGKKPVFDWEEVLASNAPNRAIVAVSEESILDVGKELLKLNVSRLLLEKPGGPSISALREFSSAAGATLNDVYVAYNRRHYSNVATLKSMILEDGGVTSIHFDFSERSKQISALRKGPGVKENWFLHNSTHVVNLVNYVCDGIEIESSKVRGSIVWHPKGAQFSGIGSTASGGLLTYSADWQAPASWEIVVKTRERKLWLKPLETLSVTDLEGNTETFQEASGTLHGFKPGLKPMVEDFLSDKPTRTLLRFKDQITDLHIYEKILDV